MKVSINGLTVEGADKEEFEYALSRVSYVSSLAKELGASVSSSKPALNIPAAATDYCAAWLESELNTRSLERFRMTAEEKLEFGEGGRNEAARVRLINAGMLTGEGGTVEAVSSDSVAENASLTAAFDE